MFSPFKLVAELISVGVQIAFLYGLAIIISFGVLAYVLISSEPKNKIVYIKVATPDTPKEVCYAIAGCKVNPDTGKLIK
jgi:hypothetical protein